MIAKAESLGSILHCRELSDHEYDFQLRSKLLEEASEVRTAASKSELVAEIADVLEVIESLCLLHDIDKDSVFSMQSQKRNERGGFCDRKFVETAEHPVGSFLEKYCLDDPEKYPEIKDL